MLVQQALFTSMRSRKSQGYHLVAASSEVDDTVARALSAWGPSHAALLSDEPHAESLNFHPVHAGWLAVSRTVHGGPEYSGRGGLEVFTRFLLLRPEQLHGYRNDPLQFALTAMALGRLHFQPEWDESLPAVDMPDHALAGLPKVTESSRVPLDEILRILNLQNRVAVLGLDNPLPTLAQILRHVPTESRLSVSFSTGLRVSVDRAFRIHFAPRCDASLRAQLASHGIDYVTTI